MSLEELAEQIADLPVSTAIRTGMSWRWLFPTIESAHVIAIAVVFGSILLLDLRLLGMGERSTRVSRFAVELLPLTWAAFAVAVVTGVLMFMANAPNYVFNVQFRWKMVLLLVAGLNMAVFHRGIYRRVADWDDRLPPPAAAKIAGLTSIACWTAVIFLGRWVGFTI